MAGRHVSELALRHFHAEVKKFHLRPIKKLHFQFDPFHENATTVRDILFHLSSKRIRKTSETCIIKSDILCDRSEPTINIDLSNGMNVLFKCANLDAYEIAREFNNIVEKYDVIEEEPTIKLKGLKETTAKKRRK